ncbi:MAG: hypothetical protein N2999_00310 [Proteobacteria bacterium]|nr:hypothetical protein [Pseudomonadota bacterium]
MAKIVKLIDLIEKKTEELAGEVVSPSGVKNIDILNYIEKRLQVLSAKSDMDNMKKLSAENEKSFLMKLKKRIDSDD